MLKAYITEEEFDKLNDAEQMNYLWCPRCRMFYKGVRCSCGGVRVKRVEDIPSILRDIMKQIYAFEMMQQRPPSYVYLGHKEYFELLDCILSYYVTINKEGNIMVCGVEVLEVNRKRHIHTA